MKELLGRLLDNKKTSGGVIGTLIVAVAGIWGLNLPADVVSAVALVITSFIGLFAKD